MFAVVKDEFLIAVDPKSSILPESSVSSGKMLRDQVPQENTNKPFKSFAWSYPICQLGGYYHSSFAKTSNENDFMILFFSMG